MYYFSSERPKHSSPIAAKFSTLSTAVSVSGLTAHVSEPVVTPNTGYTVRTTPVSDCSYNQKATLS